MNGAGAPIAVREILSHGLALGLLGGTAFSGWDGLCQLDDLLPTVRGVVETGSSPEAVAGRSLIPGYFQPREAVFTQMYPLWGDFNRLLTDGLSHRDGLLANLHAYWRVVRTRDWKYIHSSDGRHQLYDLRSDADETRNLAGSLEAADLRDGLKEWWAAQPQYVPGASDDRSLRADPRDFDLLRQLGYVTGPRARRSATGRSGPFPAGSSRKQRAVPLATG